MSDNAVGLPVLWQIKISHYSEKVRWVLDWKRVQHERRTPTPPSHMAIALWLTRGRQVTFPVLEIDGRTVGGSAAIVAALEELRPERSLLPADRAGRQAALELERWFDSEVGPATRLVAWHHTVAERESLEQAAAMDLPGPLARSALGRRAGGAFAGAFVSARFRVRGDDAAASSLAVVEQAFERVESQLGDGDEHLIGEELTLADITAASLLYPIVRPAGAPALPPAGSAFERIRDGFRGRRGWEWVERTFATFREKGAARAA